MSTRVHTTGVRDLHVVFVTEQRQLEALALDSPVPLPALVIEDPFNCEAMIVVGSPEELDRFGRDVRLATPQELAVPWVAAPTPTDDDMRLFDDLLAWAQIHGHFVEADAPGTLRAAITLVARAIAHRQRDGDPR